MLHQVYSIISEWGFEGIGVFIIQMAMLILLVGKLFQFVHFVLKKK